MISVAKWSGPVEGCFSWGPRQTEASLLPTLPVQPVVETSNLIAQIPYSVAGLRACPAAPAAESQKSAVLLGVGGPSAKCSPFCVSTRPVTAGAAVKAFG